MESRNWEWPSEQTKLSSRFLYEQEAIGWVFLMEVRELLANKRPLMSVVGMTAGLKISPPEPLNFTAHSQLKGSDFHNSQFQNIHCNSSHFLREESFSVKDVLNLKWPTRHHYQNHLQLYTVKMFKCHH